MSPPRLIASLQPGSLRQQRWVRENWKNPIQLPNPAGRICRRASRPTLRTGFIQHGLWGIVPKGKSPLNLFHEPKAQFPDSGVSPSPRFSDFYLTLDASMKSNERFGLRKEYFGRSRPPRDGQATLMASAAKCPHVPVINPALWWGQVPLDGKSSFSGVWSIPAIQFSLRGFLAPGVFGSFEPSTLIVTDD